MRWLAVALGLLLSLSAYGQDWRQSPSAAGQLPGTATNDNACAGCVGEVIQSTVLFGAAIGLTNNTATDITTINLTPGDWDVWGTLGWTGGATTTVTFFQGAITTTANNLGNITQSLLTVAPGGITQFGLAQIAYPLSAQRAALAASTTYHLVSLCQFAVSTCSGFGTIIARRRR
jgi:hypothetical protein